MLQELPRYLKDIVPPVLACFTDQDARVRYYACESMYNIAKVAKGEILVYFNHIFDALCKVCDVLPYQLAVSDQQSNTYVSTLFSSLAQTPSCP